MSTLLDKISKNSSIKESSVLSDSKFFKKEREFISTPIPIINAALSGDLSGGFGAGTTTIAGESKRFKSLLGLVAVRSFLDHHEDGVVLFYDNEFGITPEYLESVGVDSSRVIHSPLTHIEQLKFDARKQLEEITEGDKVMFFIDSLGNVASKKEDQDALEGNSKADMTRAKELKSFYRIVRPYLMLKDIPMWVINHTYKSMDMYPQDIVSGGTGGIYNSDSIFVITRSQEKDSQRNLEGYKFTINVQKSRFVKEGSKLPFVVNFDSGIDKWSGLLDIAVETGHVVKPKKGWFSRPTVENDKQWRRKETSCSDFWEPILADTDFSYVIEQSLTLGGDGTINLVPEEEQ